MRILWLLFLMLSVSAAAQRSATIRVPLLPSEEVAVVTFDADRTSTAQVKRWMKLDEHSYYASPVTHKFYSCKVIEKKRYISKLEDEISKSQQVVSDLDPNAYPPELSHVVMYLKRLQSFWLWQTEQELGYMRSGDVPELEWQDVSSNGKCGSTVEKLRDIKDGDEGCRVVFFDWLTCTNKTFLDQLGPYPKADWNAFLNAYNLQVKIVSTAGN